MMKPFRYQASTEQLASLARHYPGLVKQEHRRPARGMFLLHFDNKKRQLSGYQSHECEGVLYSSGVVHLNTHAFPIREFATLSEMREMLEEHGECSITWLESEK